MVTGDVAQGEFSGRPSVGENVPMVNVGTQIPYFGETHSLHLDRHSVDRGRHNSLSGRFLRRGLCRLYRLCSLYRL